MEIHMVQKHKRYALRLEIATALGNTELVTVHRTPLKALKQQYENVKGHAWGGGKHSQSDPKHPHAKGGNVKLTGGLIDESMFPADKYNDKNGKPLTGVALQKRHEKLTSEYESQKVQPVTDTAVTDVKGYARAMEVVKEEIGALPADIRFEKLETTVGELKDVVTKLVDMATATATK